MTAINKVNVAHLSPGDRILVTTERSKASLSRTVTGKWFPARLRMGTTNVRVVRVEAFSVNGKRRYNVVTEYGTVENLTGGQTFFKGRDA